MLFQQAPEHRRTGIEYPEAMTALPVQCRTVSEGMKRYVEQ
jgi:hypothetical protein